MAIKAGTVYIVHHVDTEGPLAEPWEETFRRVENTLGIKIPLERTKHNLQRLQRGLWKAPNRLLAEKIIELLDPHLLGFKGSWREIEQMLRIIMSRDFRRAMKDSYGGGWVYNWHVMDHVGFVTNERRRDLGYHKVFNRYEKLMRETKSTEDAIHWHFHPIPFFREAHIPATSYENSYSEIHQVISRRLIDKEWFPRVNRAGFHAERPDSNWFLEQWIPFDPSNQATGSDKGELQKDAINGRYGDWRGAPSDWSIYSPGFYDWRAKGSMNRKIARVLNMRGRFRNINEQELSKAFEVARRGQDVYVGITNHDWRDMEKEIDDFRNMLSNIKLKFRDVKYKFSEAIQAFRAVLGHGASDVKKNAIDLDAFLENGVLNVRVVRGEIFGPQPYLALKTKKGEYFHDNFDFGRPKKEFFYTFDRYTLPMKSVEKIAVASNDKYGNTCAIHLSVSKTGKVAVSKIRQ